MHVIREHTKRVTFGFQDRCKDLAIFRYGNEKSKKNRDKTKLAYLQEL